MPKQIKILLVVVSVLVIALVGYKISQKASMPENAMITTGVANVMELPREDDNGAQGAMDKKPAPAGRVNIDEAINTILVDIGTESQFFDDVAKDGELIGADSQEVNNITQSYEGNEF